MFFSFHPKSIYFFYRQIFSFIIIIFKFKSSDLLQKFTGDTSKSHRKSNEYFLHIFKDLATEFLSFAKTKLHFTLKKQNALTILYIEKTRLF